MLKAVIIDDEKHCISRLERLMKPYANLIEVVARCTSVSNAKSAIVLYKPNVIFLDVELQNETGFDLLAQLTNIDFEVVFTTAHNKYAVDAFRYSAMDFLLKPIGESDIKRTLSKLREHVSLKDMATKIELLFYNLESRNGSPKKITIPTQEGLTVVNSSDIIRCQSDANYTHLYFKDKTKIIASKTLKYFEESLENLGFFRSHQSHLINMGCINKYVKGKGGYVVMNDNSTVEISVRRKEEFLKRLNGK
tara:strand:+ start:3610 stop:4359 length:750 start_codon:yes stop_codon:yes gene_type:complete